MGINEEIKSIKENIDYIEKYGNDTYLEEVEIILDHCSEKLHHLIDMIDSSQK